MGWRLGYNTNGFQNHRLFDALEVISEIGYQSVALTLDHCHLDPFTCSWEELRKLKEFLESRGMGCVIETGARYLLDKWRKHYPSLVSQDAKKRLDYLKRAMDIAEELGASCVTFFSGAPEEGEEGEKLWERLFQRLDHLFRHHHGSSFVLALEPEPGMVVETVRDYLKVKEQFPALKLTLDIGHLFCVSDFSLEEVLQRCLEDIANVHIEDVPKGEHRHVPFGEGSLDFDSIFALLAQIPPSFPLHVELSRDSHRAPLVARRAFEFLTARLGGVKS